MPDVARAFVSASDENGNVGGGKIVDLLASLIADHPDVRSQCNARAVSASEYIKAELEAADVDLSDPLSFAEFQTLHDILVATAAESGASFPPAVSGFLIATSPSEGWTTHGTAEQLGDGPPSTDDEDDDGTNDSFMSSSVSGGTREGSFRVRAPEKIARAQQLKEKITSDCLTSHLITPAFKSRSLGDARALGRNWDPEKSDLVAISSAAAAGTGAATMSVAPRALARHDVDETKPVDVSDFKGVAKTPDRRRSSLDKLMSIASIRSK